MLGFCHTWAKLAHVEDCVREEELLEGFTTKCFWIGVPDTYNFSFWRNEQQLQLSCVGPSIA